MWYGQSHLPTPQSFLLRQPRPGMGVAIPLVIKRQSRIPTGLRPALPARIALRAPRAPPRTGALPRRPTRKTRRIVHIIVIGIDALGTFPQLLPSTQELLLGDLHVRMSRATPVFVVPDSRSDGGGARSDGTTRGGRPPGGTTSAAGHGGGIVSSSSRLFLVPRLDALGTSRHEDLPAAAHFLRGHLDLGVVMAASLFVEGGGEFLVHVAAAAGGFLGEFVGRAVELGFALFDFARAAEGRDAAGFVEFGGAFGAVLENWILHGCLDGLDGDNGLDGGRKNESCSDSESFSDSSKSMLKSNRMENNSIDRRCNAIITKFHFHQTHAKNIQVA